MKKSDFYYLFCSYSAEFNWFERSKLRRPLQEQNKILASWKKGNKGSIADDWFKAAHVPVSRFSVSKKVFFRLNFWSWLRSVRWSSKLVNWDEVWWAVVVAQVVAHRTTNREIPGSIPTVGWAFFSCIFLFSFLSRQSLNGVLNQVPRGGATLLLFPKKNGGLAVELEAKQA